MDKWDVRFLDLAQHIASWSKDPSTQVGAVIVDDKHRVVSLGYNGLPRTVCDSDELLDDRETKYQCVVHAEENAILFAGRPLDGCTIYVWPMPPCSRCAAKIVQTGIVRVVAPVNGYTDFDDWQSSFALSDLLYGDAVQLRLVDYERAGILTVDQ